MRALGIAAIFHIIGTALSWLAFVFAMTSFTSNSSGGMAGAIIGLVNCLFFPAFAIEWLRHLPSTSSFGQSFFNFSIATIPSISTILWSLVVGFVFSHWIKHNPPGLNKKRKNA